MGLFDKPKRHEHGDAGASQRLEQKLDLIIELLCAECGLAAQERMHPQKKSAVSDAEIAEVAAAVAGG